MNYFSGKSLSAPVIESTEQWGIGAGGGQLARKRTSQKPLGLEEGSVDQQPERRRKECLKNS